jgi:hypothetical protein
MGRFSRALTGGNPKGYGRQDRQMARALANAKDENEADRIARANGLRDARDARSWLRERS